jgi:hypothetical protein
VSYSRTSGIAPSVDWLYLMGLWCIQNALMNARRLYGEAFNHSKSGEPFWFNDSPACFSPRRNNGSVARCGCGRSTRRSCTLDARWVRLESCDLSFCCCRFPVSRLCLLHALSRHCRVLSFTVRAHPPIHSVSFSPHGSTNAHHLSNSRVQIGQSYSPPFVYSLHVYVSVQFQNSVSVLIPFFVRIISTKARIR